MQYTAGAAITATSSLVNKPSKKEYVPFAALEPKKTYMAGDSLIQIEEELREKGAFLEYIGVWPK
jgi:hypothetical protein